jgi:hypothetical protein
MYWMRSFDGSDLSGMGDVTGQTLFVDGDRAME